MSWVESKIHFVAIKKYILEKIGRAYINSSGNWSFVIFILISYMWEFWVKRWAYKDILYSFLYKKYLLYLFKYYLSKLIIAKIN